MEQEVKIAVTINFCCPCRAVNCPPCTPYRFTPREQEVAELMAVGKRQIDIAVALTISIRTARHHEGMIREKLGGCSRFEAAIRLNNLFGLHKP